MDLFTDLTKRLTGKHTIIAGERRQDAKLVASSTLAHEKLGWSAKHSDPETLIGSTWKVYKENFKK